MGEICIHERIALTSNFLVQAASWGDELGYFGGDWQRNKDTICSLPCRGFLNTSCYVEHNFKGYFLPILVALSGLLPGAKAAETFQDGFYRYPTIGADMIVFAAEGDLWRVPVGGGVALRLTAFEGEEAFPKLSPD